MSTFAFVPRSVKRKKVEATTSAPRSASTSSPAHPHSQVSSTIPSAPSLAGAQIARGTPHLNGSNDGQDVKGTNRRDADKDASRAGAEDTFIKPSRPSDTTVGASKTPDAFDLVALVSLALSDYALWADVDLRRKIDWSSASADTAANTEEVTNGENAEATPRESHGYIPLAYLFRRSPVLRLVSTSSTLSNQPETAYVKALRTHASEDIDVRLIVSPEPSTTFWRKWTSVGTGYEIRKKNPTRIEHTKGEWGGLTVYMENIPIQHRSLPGIVRLVVALLSAPSDTLCARLARLQHISFPPHHKDRPGDIPVCKGFASVTLSHKTDVERLLKDWPWDTTPEALPTPKEQTPMEIDDDQSEAERKAARQFGLRAISKARWEALKAEYLLYRQQLVGELNQFQDAANEAAQRHGSSVSKEVTNTDERNVDHVNFRPAITSSSEEKASESQAYYPNMPQSVIRTCQTTAEEHTRAVQVPSSPSIHPGSRYPSGCLVFVRNVHPETNKTTLKTFFSQAWKLVMTHTGGGSENALDYIDYTKNLDTCHIRLSTPSHASHLVEYFTAHPIAQTSGLDAAGTAQDQPGSKPVEPELVLGKREGLYWDKVPEKVRKQAVEKALRLVRTGAEEGRKLRDEREVSEEEERGERKKRRRRK
ncbi:hypothetical protein NLJ89_g4883 [Agrocybe chaxingu]|uniref:XRRM domain-containing protein n=1 Tax=Agrocybe chaxingu TaxID=84603 RepID=A0A9W8K225_9AGAR|nr:hypothetical protein NLJ89_g4883 [Agrocybe chaxingu]